MLTRKRNIIRYHATGKVFQSPFTLKFWHFIENKGYNPLWNIVELQIDWNISLEHLLSFRHTVVHCNPLQGRTRGIQGSPYNNNNPCDKRRFYLWECEHRKYLFSLQGPSLQCTVVWRENEHQIPCKFLSFSKPFYIKILIFYLTLLLRKVNFKLTKLQQKRSELFKISNDYIPVFR